MRWDRFFDDLEDQLASEWEAERAALDTEAERLRLSRLSLAERLVALADRDPTASPPVFEFTDGVRLRCEVTRTGADWVGLSPAEGPRGAVLAPLASIVSVGMPHPDLLRSARPTVAASALAGRITLGFVLRDLVRRRVPVAVHLAQGTTLTGTIDRAGADHFDLAIHEPGAPRRTSEVTGHRIVPFAGVARVRLDGSAGAL